MRTKEQERSEFALKKILEHEEAKDMDVKTVNFIVGAPSMLITNGIGQTLAFLCSKGEKKHKIVFSAIREWLSKENIVCETTGTEVDFVRKFTELKQPQYLRAQSEALAMLKWLKRYARAFGAKS